MQLLKDFIWKYKLIIMLLIMISIGIYDYLYNINEKFIIKTLFLAGFLKLLWESNNFESNKYNLLAGGTFLISCFLICILVILGTHFENSEFIKDNISPFIYLFGFLIAYYSIIIVGITFIFRLLFISIRFFKKIKNNQF